jgi:glucose-6-phosphate isomerase
MQIEFNNVLANAVGPKHGLSKSELGDLLKKYSHIISDVKSERASGKNAFLDLPYRDISLIERLARAEAHHYEDFVVLGIGGSALGARTLLSALKPPFYNLLSSRERKNHPRLFVLDNVDPDQTQALFKIINPKKTIFNVISKSGATVETMASFLYALKIIKNAVGNHIQDHLIITTDKEKGALRKFARQERLISFEVPEGVEGRYSVLSPVGLLPAAFIGIDIKALLNGAKIIDKEVNKSAPNKNHPYLAALVNFVMNTRKGKNIDVIMPYSSALNDFGDWFSQLWAESLGKKYDLKGKEVFTGPTPVNALGVTDQHSQIQLYNEGPNNKLVIFIEVDKFRNTVKIPSVLNNDSNLKYLKGRTFNDLMRAEKKGTEISLTQNRRPNYTITLSSISEETIGGLLYFWELTTAYAGKLYNVNAFNQPGVEAGKKATALLLGKKV